jgi:hypothetical protein
MSSRLFKIIALYSSILVAHCNVAFGANSTGETVFVVGPEPRPMLPDVENSRSSSNSGGDGVKFGNVPRPSIPRSDPITGTGGRTLKMNQHQPIHASTNQATYHIQRQLQGNGCSVTDVILGFDYDDDVAVTGSTWVPPDPSGAVGASRLVAVGNSLIEVRQKDGTLTFRQALRDFFGGFLESFEPDTRFFDPKVVYDEHEGRFVVVVIQQGDSGEVSRFFLAVSKGEAPDRANDWYQININSDVVIDGVNCWADYPGFEVDEEAVYITGNMFGFAGGSFGVRLWVLDKNFYSGQSGSVTRYNPYFDDGVDVTTMPAQVHGRGGVGSSVGTFFVGYYVANDGTSKVQIYTLFNPLGATPTYTIQTINLGAIDTGSVPLATQRGSTARIDASDGRALDAVWRANKLWMTTTINPLAGPNAGQATAYWVRMDTSGGVVTLAAQDNLGGEGISSGTHTFYPAVAVNRRGQVAFGYSASSPTIYAGAFVALGDYPAGSSEQSFTVQSGKDSYADDRWGDYTGISVDPTDGSFWVFNQYAEIRVGNGRWGTVWGRLACPAPVSMLYFIYWNCAVLSLRK